MTIRREMLRAAGRAAKLLNDAAEAVERFVRGRLTREGAFRGRGDEGDLYYTVFGVESLLALGAAVPADAVASYLRTFAAGDGLDFVHLACLARCWADLPGADLDDDTRHRVLENLRRFRTPDGGYAQAPAAPAATAYGCFLALAALQDLHADLPDPARMLDALEDLRAADGGYANTPASPIGLTPATAAAVCVRLQLGGGGDESLADWLLAQRDGSGGFLAAAAAPLADLLSTATAIHALASMGADLRPIRTACLDFVDSLWTGQAFRGNVADETADCEYTYYGLLALGHLAQ